MKMPFGKHKGIEVTRLSPSYIIWVYENMKLKEPLLSAVKQRYENCPAVAARQNQILDWDQYDEFDGIYPEYF